MAPPCSDAFRGPWNASPSVNWTQYQGSVVFRHGNAECLHITSLPFIVHWVWTAPPEYDTKRRTHLTLLLLTLHCLPITCWIDFEIICYKFAFQLCYSSAASLLEWYLNNRLLLLNAKFVESDRDVTLLRKHWPSFRVSHWKPRIKIPNVTFVRTKMLEWKQEMPQTE